MGELWVAERARWLDVSEEEVGRDPPSFEDSGTLQNFLTQKTPVVEPPDLSDLSYDERDFLEDCLESTCRPFPELLGRACLGRLTRGSLSSRARIGVRNRIDFFSGGRGNMARAFLRSSSPPTGRAVCRTAVARCVRR